MFSMVSALRCTGEFSITRKISMKISIMPTARVKPKAAKYRGWWVAGLDGAGNATPPVPGTGANVREVKNRTISSQRFTGKLAMKMTARMISIEPI